MLDDYFDTAPRRELNTMSMTSSDDAIALPFTKRRDCISKLLWAARRSISVLSRRPFRRFRYFAADDDFTACFARAGSLPIEPCAA